jgi:hypothetical protein
VKNRAQLPRFADVCEEWLSHGEQERQLEPSTLVDYRSSLSARILPALGSSCIDTITASDLEQWRQRLLEQAAMSNRAINKLFMVVAAVGPAGPAACGPAQAATARQCLRGARPG